MNENGYSCILETKTNFWFSFVALKNSRAATEIKKPSNLTEKARQIEDTTPIGK